MSDDPRIDPADLRGVRFPGSFRRYDARAVDEFLESVAQRIEATNALVDDLRARLGEGDDSPSERGSSSAVTVISPPADPFADERPGTEPDDVDRSDGPVSGAEVTGPTVTETPDLSTLSDDELARLVGDETAHVLGTARKAAEEIRSKAEDSAARVIREATAEANRLTAEAKERASTLTAEAESVRADAVAAAEEAAAAVTAEAETRAAQLRADAEQEAAEASERADAIRAEAEAEAARAIEEARTEGRSMVGEAKEVRARVLADLQRRRDVARSQIDRLVAGRDRLLEAYAAVRANVDEMTGELDTALVDAASPTTELDAEIEAAAAHVAATDEDDTLDGGSADPVDVGSSPEEHGAGADPAASDGDDETAGEPPVTDGETGGDPESESEPGPGSEETDEEDVDALFARIRSERAESVARAQEVLGESVADADADPDAEASDDAELAADGASEEADAADGEIAEELPTLADGPDDVPAELLAPADVLAARDESLAPLEKSLARALKRHLADEQNDVLDHLRQSESTAVDDLLPAVDDHAGAYAAVAADSLADAMRAGARGSDVDDGAVESAAAALGDALTEPFRRRIERSAADVDGDADALDERLRALYREWKVERIGPTVVDALLSAYAAGQLAAADGGSVRWLIDPEQGPCPDAQDNALAGVVSTGDPFPTGDSCPQAHPGCRCVLVPE